MKEQQGWKMRAEEGERGEKGGLGSIGRRHSTRGVSSLFIYYFLPAKFIIPATIASGMQVARHFVALCAKNVYLIFFIISKYLK